MCKGNDKLRPLGIYHRFISFITSNVIGRGHKKVSLGGAASAMPPVESIEVPIEGSIRIMPSMTNIGRDAFNNEVIIDFRHIEEPEMISTSVQKLSSRVDFPKKNGFISMADQTPMQQQGKERQKHSHPRGFGKGHGEENYPNASKRNDSEKDHKEKYKPKAKDIPTETTSGNEGEEARRKQVDRASRPPLMSVASDINKKADAFIRSRKETMKKNFWL